MILSTALLGPGMGTLDLSFRTQPIGRKVKGGKADFLLDSPPPFQYTVQTTISPGFRGQRLFDP
jgi:hypothetical protein